MKTKIALLSAISLSVLLSACCGNDHYREHGDRDRTQMMSEYYFHQMDKNDNDTVSMKEYMSYEHMRFQQADTNHDGMLSLDELVAQKLKEKEAMREWNHTYNNGTYSNMNNSQQ